jgi:hypothetical protein
MRKLIWILLAQMATIVGNAQPYTLPGGYIEPFEFQVFYYSNDLEIAPGSPMTLTGPVYAGGNAYFEPAVSLNFDSVVYTSGQSIIGEDPLDPTSRSLGAINFAVLPLTNVFPYRFPDDPSGTNGYGLLQIPPAGENPHSPTTPTRLFNYTDMIVILSNNNNIGVTSGVLLNGQATVINGNQWQFFITTNDSFYDQRDGLTVNPITINVSNLVSWSATNTVLRPVLENQRGPGYADVISIYIADERSTSNEVIVTNFTTTVSFPAPGTYYPPVTTNRNSHGFITGYTYATSYITNWVTIAQPGIVLSNGSYLTPNGLTIATPDPVYIVGNWNVQQAKGGASDAGQTNTTDSLPSGIFVDAITVLSPAWNPANSTSNLNARLATSDTVNAAFLTGDVPSDGTNYSGGLENLPRLLENWSGQTFTYNGSLCCMFSSQIANAPYPGTGIVYNPPTRNWAFDTSFVGPLWPAASPLLKTIVTSAPVVSATQTNGSIFVSCNSHPLATYELQSSASILQPNWQSFGSNVATSNTITFSDLPTNSQQFYRMNVTP